MNSKRVMAQMLKHLLSAGVTHVPKVNLPKPSRILPRHSAGSTVAEQPTSLPDRSRARDNVAVGTSALADRPKPAPVIRELRRAEPDLNVRSSPNVQAPQSGPLPELIPIMAQPWPETDARREALRVVSGCVAGCQRCPELASTRTQTVFGVGNPSAEILFIGEAPGADEDATGEPFVGAAGQLLNKIIAACHLQREDLYICNILRCRPPGNRNPLPQEAQNCREYLDAQIHIVQPKYIVCWGTVAAQNLLSEVRAVGKLRGQWFDYRGIKVICTYHPSYLLRNPAAKKQVWEDMKFLMTDRGVELT